jgi:cysteine protease ATG4
MLNKNKNQWKPLIILMPLRLGLEKLNPIYIRFICKIFEMSQSLGIVGGKPSSSFYFIGCQDESLLYLDPHVVQCVSNEPEVLKILFNLFRLINATN